MNDTSVRSDTQVTLDPESPWLGLDSYSEATRAYFHGRDEEAAELARRVQHGLLTILFGQSGLGKTSLLRAGLVPRLRDAGYCPVYVRIDYAPESPAPSEQIKRAVFRATAEAGHWTRPGSAIEGESLWEFLHHRGDLLRDAAGRTLVPLLIFDQFEEIFTLGQADDAGRLRAKQFLEDLADLVENRAPASLEARLENDDSAIEDFDFARADYRVLIALREDYLAHLESLKHTMPSITQNRMRLARMNGTQALSAVVKPGGKLVSREVAESIVRFVAGGSELANAEIEPSLLSLVCRELNNIRLAQHRREISTDLLAGSRDNILAEFYERALADQPAGVRRVVEDELLTESGYRESLAEERVCKALAEAGATPDALATLVNRRLLRIEERLDMRRVELTHDVLCGVVLASRNQRHAREAREQAERELAAQRDREAAIHRTLVRTRMVATVCIVLLVVAAIGAAFGFWSLHRAHTAEAEAQNSRANAESLVSFLIEDFYNELAPTGRLETLGTLARKTVAYYDSLPPALRTKQTQINRAMALVREGAAQQSSGKLDDAGRSFGAAQTVFEKLRAGGDHGEAVTYGLALALEIQGSSIIGGSGRGNAAQLQKAADLLRPLVYGKDPSRRVGQLYGDTLNYLSHTQPTEQAVQTCNEARKVLAGLGALDLTDLDAASSYADTADSEARYLLLLGRFDEAHKLEQEVAALADKLLARRPGDLHALAVRFFATELLGSLAHIQHDAAAAANYARQAAQAGEDEVRFDPSNLQGWTHWSGGLSEVAEFQADRGELAKAIATGQTIQALAQDKRRPTDLAPVLARYWGVLVLDQADAGDAAGAAQSMQRFRQTLGKLAAQLPSEDSRRLLFPEIPEVYDGAISLLQDKPGKALSGETAVIGRLDAIQPTHGSIGALIKKILLEPSLQTAARAALMTGDYKQAEAFARRLQGLPNSPTSEANPKERIATNAALLAHALAGQGQYEQARAILQPALDYYREQQKAGASGVQYRYEFAYALYVDALASADDSSQAHQRADTLSVAAQLIADAPGDGRNTVRMRQLSGLIATARSKPNG
ncbi:MAG TPA: hypothetical protein VFL63_12010 [Rhodanobacteraceae bacterium]|nr:hypothetical protein [Rhodanobacteraceae bacterium]